MVAILNQVALDFIHKCFIQEKRDALKEKLLTRRALELVAMKIDKLSGDLRVAFEILRKTIQRKIQFLQENKDSKDFSITYTDTNETITEMFQSKTAGIIKKMPRSYIILLTILEEVFMAKNTNMIEQTSLLGEYNRQATQMMIDRISPKDLEDMVEGLVNSSIVSRKDIKKKKHVKLDVELEELTEALKLY